MTTYTWQAGATGDLADASKWGGTVPGTDSAGVTDGRGTLSYAIAQISADDPAGRTYVTNLTGDVSLSGPLSPILGSVTINGNGHKIDAGGAQRIFFVDPPATARSAAAARARRHAAAGPAAAGRPRSNGERNLRSLDPMACPPIARGEI